MTGSWGHPEGATQSSGTALAPRGHTAPTPPPPRAPAPRRPRGDVRGGAWRRAGCSVVSFRAGASRASHGGSTGGDLSLFLSAWGFRVPAGRRCAAAGRAGRVSVGAGARLVRGIVWRGHVHPSPTAAARTAQRRGRVGAWVRGEPGPAWGGFFSPRSLRQGALQPRRLSLRGDPPVVPRRGRLGKFGFAQRNLRRLRKVARCLHEGIGQCCVV